MADVGQQRSQQQNLMMAAVSCVILGVGLMLWGIAPLLIERLATGRPPTINIMTAVNGLVMLLGVCFLGLALLIPHMIRWACWTAYIGALVLCALATSVTLFLEAMPGCLFVLILSASATFSCWIGLGAIPKTGGTPALDDAGFPRARD